MPTTVIYLGPLVTLLILLIVIYLIIKLGYSLVVLALNSLLGLVALWLINLLPFIQIDINIWSILIVALGGLPGLALLILLDVLGIAF